MIAPDHGGSGWTGGMPLGVAKRGDLLLAQSTEAHRAHTVKAFANGNHMLAVHSRVPLVSDDTGSSALSSAGMRRDRNLTRCGRASMSMSNPMSS